MLTLRFSVSYECGTEGTERQEIMQQLSIVPQQECGSWHWTASRDLWAAFASRLLDALQSGKLPSAPTALFAKTGSPLANLAWQAAWILSSWRCGGIGGEQSGESFG